MDITYSYTNLDITSYISVLVLFEKEVLHVLQNQDQPAWLIAGLQEKTSYKSALFPIGGSRTEDALQKKTTGSIINKVERETTN